jgi:hypothetical protein
MHGRGDARLAVDTADLAADRVLEIRIAAALPDAGAGAVHGHRARHVHPLALAQGAEPYGPLRSIRVALELSRALPLGRGTEAVGRERRTLEVRDAAAGTGEESDTRALQAGPRVFAQGLLRSRDGGGTPRHPLRA